MHRRDKLIEEDLFVDIKPTPHHKLHPKSRKTYIVLMTILLILLVLAIFRAIKIMF